MRALDQWEALEERLGPSWEEAVLSFVPEDAGAAAEAAAILAPLGPGRRGRELRLRVSRKAAGDPALRNLLRRLDERRLWGTLSLEEARTEGAEAPAPAPAQPARRRTGLAASWEAETAKLPPGWRDLLCELELDSSDYLPRAALLGAPLNPTRVPGALALRFRVGAPGAGYGASPGMARRCLERMDAEGITGRVRVLHALADTENVHTQGPVWRIAGRSV